MNTIRKALCLLIGLVMLVSTFGLPISQGSAPRLSWAQFAEWNQPISAVKKWSPLEPSIRFFKRSSAADSFDNTYPEM